MRMRFRTQASTKFLHRDAMLQVLIEKTKSPDFIKVAVVKDFLGGIDPTGVKTFQFASRREKGHGPRRAAAVAGGVVGGTAIGALLPAALMAGTSLVMKARGKGALAKSFMTSAKGSFDVVNPLRMVKHVKSIKPALKYQAAGEEALTAGQRVMKNVKSDPLTWLKNTMTGGTKGGSVGGMGKDVNTLRKATKEMDTLGANLSKKYYGGADPMTGGMRTMTALTTVPAAVGTGMLSGSSSALQYNAALREKEKKKNENLQNLGRRILKQHGRRG